MNELSNRTPTIRLWNLLLIPIQRDLDDTEAEQVKEEVLSVLHGASIEGLILDVTGLWLMDSHLCAVLTQLARAAALMGTRTVLCGVSAEIAMTIQTMGLELESVETTLSLEQALEMFGVRGSVIEEESGTLDILSGFRAG